MFGLLGLPHILMRFYTVPDARAARSSVLYATGFIGYFYLIIPIVGFGASALVGREIIRSVDSGGNMAAPLVAELLGGTPFLGFIAAVAFALSHDIFTHAIRKGAATEYEQIRVARIATVVFGLVAVVLGILFKGQNVAFMVGLAFAVAASANFPALLLSIVWSRFSTAGAVCSIVTGALLSVVLIVLSPTIWVDLLHHGAAIFPLRNPAIVSMPAGFLAGVIASLLVREPEAEAKFHDEKLTKKKKRTYAGSAPSKWQGEGKGREGKEREGSPLIKGNDGRKTRWKNGIPHGRSGRASAARARACARQGAKVIATDVDVAGLEALKKEQPQIETVQLDVLDPAQCEAIGKRWPEINVLLNIARLYFARGCLRGTLFCVYPLHTTFQRCRQTAFSGNRAKKWTPCDVPFGPVLRAPARLHWHFFSFQRQLPSPRRCHRPPCRSATRWWVSRAPGRPRPSRIR